MPDTTSRWFAKPLNFIVKHTLLLLSLMSITVMLVAFSYLSRSSEQATQDSAITSAQHYLQALAEFRTLYTTEVVQVAKRYGLKVSHDYRHQDNAIPLPATLSMALGERIGGHQSGAKSFLYSAYPFPWRQQEQRQRLLQPFARDAWRQLNAKPEQPFYRFEDYDGRPSIRFAVADRMREACVNCHNSHPATPKNDWRVGDVRGVLEVVLPINQVQAQTQSSLRATFLVLGLMALLLALVLWIVFTRLQRDKRQLTASNQALNTQKEEIERQSLIIGDNHQRLEKHAAELEQANRHRSDFLACMSHEIRTPMNGVIGMLGLLLNGELNPEQLRKAKVAQSSAGSLLALVNDILDFSKVETGQLNLECVDFNLHSLLNELGQTMAFRAEAKGLELILDTTDIQHSMVKGDPGRLRQILTNLASNAIKFTEQGEVVIRAGLQQTDTKNLNFTCSVCDTGIGIPADQHAKIFETFVQVDASTTRQYGGTGLGLALCQQLCQQMEGGISVSSGVAKGSCFEFHINLQTSQQSCQLVPRVAVDRLRILIVDDNATNREVLRGQLQHWGVKVVEAASASAALQILVTTDEQASLQPFDLALVDMQMPGIDGAQLAQTLQADTRFNDLKLVMMTSMASRGDAEYFANLGFSAYFPKPVSPNDLLNAIAVLIDGGQALQQATPLVTQHYLQSLQYEPGSREYMPVSPQWSSNYRLLLVEDNNINQQVALGVLEDLGLTADTAIDGIDALHMLKSSKQEQTYNLVLMDCQMPEMDGYEATRRIRAGKAGADYQSIPIIAITANAMAGDREKCLAAGMNDYLSKPIDAELLLETLMKWLPSEKPQRVGTTQPVPTSAPTEVPEAGLGATVAEAPKVLWDKAASLKRVGGKTERLNILLGLFMKDMPERMVSLQRAVDDCDLKEVQQLAHTVKGVAANLGALTLQELANQIQYCHEPHQLTGLMAAAQLAYQTVTEEFNRHLET